MDGDGLDELVCGSPNRWLDVDGGTTVDLGVVGALTHVEVHDLDGDGVDEVVGLDEDELIVFDADGRVRTRQPDASGGWQRQDGLQDLDGDGVVERVRTDGDIVVERWDPAAGFVPDQVLAPASGAPFQYPHLADLTGDGDLELVHYRSGLVEVLDLSSGATLYSNGGSGSSTAADIDGDGVAELIRHQTTFLEVVDVRSGTVRAVVYGDVKLVATAAGARFVRRVGSLLLVMGDVGGSFGIVDRVDICEDPGLWWVVSGGRVWYVNADGLVGWSPFDDTRWLVPGIDPYAHTAALAEGRVWAVEVQTSIWQP